MIVEKITECRKKRIKSSPCHTNRASGLGHPCMKFLYLLRTRSDEKTLHGESLQSIFEMGNFIEKIVYRELDDAGFDVIGQQRSFNLPEYKITGHTDGYIIVNGETHVLEIKSCSPFVFGSLRDEKSLREHKSYYIRGYITQLNLYMFMSDKKTGVLLFKEKSTGAYKEIWIERDDELCEQIFAKAEAINKAVDDKVAPECMDYDSNICTGCGFKHICGNSPQEASHKFIEDPATEELLDEFYKLSEYVKRSKEIDKILKEKLVGQNDIIIGNFLITGKYRETKYYDVPQALKDPYAQTRRNWFKKIIPL